MRWVVLVGVMLGGCGARGPVWPAGEGSHTVPLVLAWQPSRLLVEVAINGIGPMLFVVDTGVTASRVRPDVAERLGLRRVGDPTRGRRVVAPRFAMGDLVLREVVLRVDEGLLGELYGRPVVGVVGVEVWAGRRLEHDRGAGVLRLPGAGAAVPAGAGEVSVGVGVPTLPVRIAGEAVRLRFASGRAASALTWAAARRVGAAGEAPVVMVDGVATGQGSGQGPWQVIEEAVDDGHLGLPGLAGLDWRLDAARGRFLVWPAASEATHFKRFGPLPCAGRDCLHATIAAVERGRVTVAFAEPTGSADDRPAHRPAHRLPERYWLRVDLGAPGRPFGALVQLRARPAGIEGPLTAVLDDDRIGPASIRPVGAVIDVLDVVPVDRPCAGVVCLHRQEGDAADSFVESSAAAVGGPGHDTGSAPALRDGAGGRSPGSESDPQRPTRER